MIWIHLKMGKPYSLTFKGATLEKYTLWFHNDHHHLGNHQRKSWQSTASACWVLQNFKWIISSLKVMPPNVEFTFLAKSNRGCFLLAQLASLTVCSIIFINYIHIWTPLSVHSELDLPDLIATLSYLCFSIDLQHSIIILCVFLCTSSTVYFVRKSTI